MKRPEHPSDAPAGKGANVPLCVGLCVGVIAVLLACGIVPRIRQAKAVQSQAAATATQIVTLIKPETPSSTQDLVLPGSVAPYISAPIYARVSGYLSHWYTDIGTHVKAGQLLAKIEAPELDAQLQQALADKATAQANYTFAALTAARWERMLRTQSVAQQDADAKVSDMQAKHALLLSAEANVAQLAQRVAYERILAPFDGVITARNVDIGALVSAGDTGSATSGQSGELFHLQQTNRLRVYVDVPQADASYMSTKPQAWIDTSGHPSTHIPAVVARNANALDTSSRTLRVELAVDNRDDALLSGSYVQVHLSVDRTAATLQLPVSALLYRPDGVNVATVTNDHAVLKVVHLGRDFGTKVEILDGLNANDRIIDNPGDALQTGQAVRVGTASHG
jgi:RND family efflux transporter MFP subunit